MSDSQSVTPKPQTKVEAKHSLSKKSAIAALWKRGIINWKLDPNQKVMYEFAMSNRHQIVVISSSRQLGKSYFLFTLATEKCLEKEQTTVVIVAPKLKMIKRIGSARMAEILADCPEALRPSFKTQDHCWEFPNGSKIYLAGTDNENYDNIRGITADLCIVDEAGFCSDLKHIVNSILIPMTTNTEGKIVLSSTPPVTMDHDFIWYAQDAIRRNAFIKRTIYDNPRLTVEKINMLAEAVGGLESTDFKREYLCEFITNPDDAIVPEFTPSIRQEIIRVWQRPKYFDTYVSMDVGFKDLTVVLFAYYDFRHDKIVVEDELVMSGSRLLTEDLARNIKEKEAKLWHCQYTLEPKPVFLRVSDNNNLILLNDLQMKYGTTFLPTLKDDAHAALNNMRMLIKQGKIIIHPRCGTLIFHLENGVWNKNKTSFARSVDSGHYDAIDSLKYLCRNVDRTKNPYPADFVDRDNTFVSPELVIPNNTKQITQAVKSLVKNPFLRRRR